MNSSNLILPFCIQQSPLALLLPLDQRSPKDENESTSSEGKELIEFNAQTDRELWEMLFKNVSPAIVRISYSYHPFKYNCRVAWSLSNSPILK